MTKALFQHLDRNGDGHVSQEEVGLLLMELGVVGGVAGETGR